MEKKIDIIKKFQNKIDYLEQRINLQETLIAISRREICQILEKLKIPIRQFYKEKEKWKIEGYIKNDKNEWINIDKKQLETNGTNPSIKNNPPKG